MMNFLEEPIQTLSNELKDTLSATDSEHIKMIRSGQMLYRQNLVQLNQRTSESIMAHVADVNFAKVKLSLISIHQSQCSCPASSICRHIIAVFFQVYAKHASVSEWVDRFKSEPKQIHLDKIKHLQTASTILLEKQVLPQEPSEWKQFIQSTFDSYLDPTLEDHQLQEIWKLYKYQLSIHSPLEMEWKQLYSLYTSFYTYQLFAILFNKHSNLSSKWRQLAEANLDQLDNSLYKLSVSSFYFAFDEFYSFLQEEVDFLLQPSTLERENIRCFRLLWTKTFKRREQWQQMLSNLEAYPNTTVVQLARGLLLLQLRDDTFFDVLDDLPTSTTPAILEWVDIIVLQKEEAKLKQFSTSFFSKIKEYMTTDCPLRERDHFSQLVLKKAKQMDASGKNRSYYEKALLATLPYSSVTYLSFLLEEEKYDQWIAYFIYTNLPLSIVSKEKIRQLEKHSPMGVLALYHREVNQLILKKNRASYVEATTYLKQMKLMYKKLQRVSQWDYYIEQLLKRYKRQRAFLEEVKRSKCLDG